MHSHTRRGFLQTALGTCWAGASLLEQSVLRAAQARAQAPGAPTNLFRLDRVTDGIYAAVAHPATFINCNAVVFENSAGLLIVDTHSTPSAVAALAAQLRKEVSPKPVRYVVETHFHGDHTQGAAAYRRLAPNLEIFSSTVTRNLIAELGAPRLRSSLEQLPKALDDYNQHLAASRNPADKAHWEKLIRDTRAYMAEMRNYTPELPDTTFSDHLIIHDKAHELHLAFHGRGHTSGDIIVFCPQKKTIATGDLAHGFFPYMGDGYPKEWPKTLQAIGEYKFDSMVGGHGGILRSRVPLNGMSAYIEELTGLVERGKQQGRTIEELRQTITPESLRSLDANGYGAFLAASLAENSDDAGGKTAGQILAGGIQGNIGDIYKTLEKS